ncbi:MAG: Putative ATP:guanido phosphotransferase YacI [uncultured Gemmatimonadetes bacterium]|uniref:ATP:guanido phosphotransferase YacI n=1 Tax=uncultured Gemmatimonadota bacterium TaxID=203437 RepID=A0A6J4LTR8_9BACT|nr:MAG: Putative ATP:guanido phosphotransferase YacI [uncultured Gemmatimonadota bacterium]
MVPQLPHESEAGLGWIEADGPHADIVLSTRIRLARNLQGFRFGTRADAGDRREVLRLARAAADGSAALGSGRAYLIPDLPSPERQLLLERHLVSRELVSGHAGEPPSDAALLTGPAEPLSVMVNEEDHLRLQTLLGGFRLHDAWRSIDRLDDELGSRLPYAYHPEFGYLTSCPTNVGTGLRASVLMHLPGLVLTQEIGKVLQGIAQVGLTFRGLYGEGSEVVGNFFQISNQTTLGKTEEDLIDHLQRIVQQVVQYESSARAVLTRDAPTVIDDKVWRAYGLLRHARTTSFEELMNLLSGVRLGVGLKLIPGVSVHTLNRIMIFAQSAHLDRVADQALPKGDPDVRRAAYVRGILAAEESGASHA